ncbi:sulfate ABC transporter permease subunit CysT [Dokdonella sp.]|uniref:sulfate ABC transporter permease subunit CysT n=1 Tax=Dokdonella sp. TaxID=2291710 RepID=UPI0025B9B240|nr:sulfate ABC transporter permease subunit CysT [Dokdonella sp.]MBX3691775.1 sulfate ABC transporter permease subunit CysT [Dokdonella sp.]MCW5568697.1 sulfate ABC transporter permease subunit CysT [Dokdonella sp.]
MRLVRRQALPGFGLTLGLVLSWLGLIVLLPLAALVLKSASIGPHEFWAAVTSPRALAAYRVTFGSAALAGLVNLVFGTLLAWVLVRYRFPGRTLIDALVDLPFALPTAVAGITLTALYAANGPLGRWTEAAGWQVAYTPSGIVVALVFVSLPFIVRSVQPVLETLEPEIEEAAATLGAGRLTVLRKVVLPALWPAILAGFALAFARAIGEYGSVIFIAGNMPMVSEIAPLLIVARLDQRDYGGASAIAVVVLAASFATLLALNLAQLWLVRRRSAKGGR